MGQSVGQRSIPAALIAALAVGIALGATLPLLAIPMAPALVVGGILTLRRSSDPLTRGLAWGALVAGICLLVLLAVTVLGFAVGSMDAVVVEGPAQSPPRP
jgi:hypothetical protein